MKKLLILMLCLCALSISAANNKVDSLRATIAHLDSTYALTPAKHQKDTLLVLLDSYRSLDTLLTRTLNQQAVELKHYVPYKDCLFLLTEDTMVFHHTIPADIHVPASLAYHFETLKMIITVRERIEIVEQKIVETGNRYTQDFLKSGETRDIKSVIASQIEKDVDELSDLLQRIVDRDLSSLSKQQKAYFKPGLTERYNNFVKFFE